MIINKPVIIETNEYIEISSIIEFLDNKQIKVWFRLDRTLKKQLDYELDAFVVGLVPIAMSLGEDMTVKGTMSQILSYNLSLYQGFFYFFYKNKLKRIKINADRYEKYNKYGKATICAFSGGVNSFYTLIKNLNDNKDNKKYEVTDILYIENLDKYYDPVLKINKKNKIIELSKKLKVRPIFIETNLKEISDKYVDFDYQSKGAIISSCGLLLKKYAGRFYIGSPFDYHVPFPYGSNPITDILCSTENFEIIHHGPDFSRIKKIEYLTDHKITYDYMFLDKKVDNRLLFSLITLSMLDRLHLYKNLSYILGNKYISRIKINNESDRYFAKEIVTFAKKNNDLRVLRIINRKVLKYDIKKKILGNRPIYSY